MTSPPREVSRRDAIRIGVLATGGLILFPFAVQRLRRGRARATALKPNVFLEIGADGIVHVTVPRPEMGQGVRTALPILIAEEAGVALDAVVLHQADFDPAYGDQYVGGSSSVRDSWLPLRRAGAAARALLIQAAARRWNVAATECDARDGLVRHGASGRTVPFGALVGEAARLPLPTDPPLRAPAAFQLIGGRHRSPDTPAIVRGAMAYGIDARAPGMLVACVERAPTFGARVATVDDREARALQGVARVVRIDPGALPAFPENSPKMPAGVAVLARDTWTAMRGRRALRITWDGGSDEDSERLRDEWTARTLRPPQFVERNDGDVARTFAAAQRKLEAVYEVPFLAHAQMEPMNCLAHVAHDRCDVWAPTQDPEGARDAAALASGLPASAVHIHPMRMGGAFGRRFYHDAVAEAVVLSREAGQPVQVVWTREDDLRHGFYRPAGVHRLRGAVDAGGRIAAWSHHLVNASRGAYLQWKPPAGAALNAGEVDGGDFPANFVAHFRLGYTDVPSAIPRGQWRAVEDSGNVFVIQSFLDELAALAGRDPLDVQLDMLSRDIGPAGVRRAFDAARLRAALSLVADRAAYHGRAVHDGGRSRPAGIAASCSHGAYVAQVAEVEHAPAAGGGAGMRVRRITVAVDCGTPVNRLGIEAQVQGAIVYGLSAALRQRITVRGGRVVEDTFGAFPPLRIDEMPEIAVHIIDSTEPPKGMGEGALPAAAPAVTNAIFALDGRRVRRLPLA